MAMAYANNITYLAMDAVRAFLASQTFATLSTDSIVAGIDGDDLPVPRVVVTCRNAAASELIYDGLWNLDVDIVVVSNAKDSTGAEHHSLCGEVFAYLMSLTTAADISAAATGFSVQQAVPRAQSWDIDGKNWKSTLRFGLLNCCGSDIS